MKRSVPPSRPAVTVGRHGRTVPALSSRPAAGRVRAGLGDAGVAVVDTHRTVRQVPPRIVT